MAGKQVLSSLPLQTLLLLNSYYDGLFLIAEILILIYKNAVLPYPQGNLAIDFVLLFILIGLEYFRIFFGSKGNLTERPGSVLVSICMLIPSAVLAVYFLLFQTFVLKLDIIFVGILLAFHFFQIWLLIMSAIVFSRYKDM